MQPGASCSVVSCGRWSSWVHPSPLFPARQQGVPDRFSGQAITERSQMAVKAHPTGGAGGVGSKDRQQVENGQAEFHGHLGPPRVRKRQVVSGGIEPLPSGESGESIWVSLHLGWNQYYEKRLPGAGGTVADLPEKFAGDAVSLLNQWMRLKRDDGLE